MNSVFMLLEVFFKHTPRSDYDEGLCLYIKSLTLFSHFLLDYLSWIQEGKPNTILSAHSHALSFKSSKPELKYDTVKNWKSVGKQGNSKTLCNFIGSSVYSETDKELAVGMDHSDIYGSLHISSPSLSAEQFVQLTVSQVFGL